MEAHLEDTLAASTLSATRSREWAHRMMGLLEAAVGQLHDLEHPAQGTLLEAASLLRLQIRPPLAGDAPDGRGRLPEWQARKVRYLKRPRCCGYRFVHHWRETLPMEEGGCRNGRHARYVNILMVTSQGRYPSRIFARSFSAAKRTFRDPSSAHSVSHRTLSSCDVAWNWPLDTCLRPMRP